MLWDNSTMCRLVFWSAVLYFAMIIDARPTSGSPSIVRAPHRRTHRSSIAVEPLQPSISVSRTSDTSTSTVSEPSRVSTASESLGSLRSTSTKIASKASKHQESSHPQSRESALDRARPPTASAPYKNIFNSLTNDEAASVIKFLHDQEPLNLTKETEAGPWDNSIMVIDLNPPNKTDALAYFDGGKNTPERWAKASISFGATEEPYVQELIVGPLPLDKGAAYFPDTFGTHAKDAKIRIYDMDDSSGFMYDKVMAMDDIVRDLLDTNFTTLKQFKKEFAVWGIDPLWREPDEHGNERIIFWIWRNGKGTGGDTLLPQGIYLRADITGRDTWKWSLTHILYGGELYHSLDDFRAAWQDSSFNKMKVNHGGDWINVESTGTKDGMSLDELPPPRQMGVGGHRFKVDEEENYVEWMGFTFFITFTRDTGMRLYDIKYQGERIVFELGLQEAIAHYAGNDPVQSGTAYLDTYYGFGPYSFNQIPGYDFPLQGYCMSTTWHADELSKTRKCGISVFEEEQPYLLQRHTSAEYVHATKNIALTVRSISTVGNYDYNFDYVFYLDGSIETIVRASGYIQSAFYANNSGYGYQIHDVLSGSMHDHSLQFKADLDIAGTSNTMLKHKFIPVDVNYKWSNITRSTMKLSKSEVQDEGESRMNWAHNSKELVLIVNKDALNKYGEERGYKIMPSRGPPGFHQTITNSTNLQKSGATGTHGYFVTNYKDEEKRSTSPWNAHDPGHPLVDFDRFFNNESLVQEDLVIWFNLGMHHVPHTGDLPNTVFTTAQSGMWITPHNYLFSDPSRKSKQMIHIDLDDNGVASSVTTYGQSDSAGDVNLRQIKWDAMAYVGDFVTRKFPYDPQYPFNQTVVLE